MEISLDLLLGPLTPTNFAYAMVVGLLGGLIKGMVGFALPMIIISGLSTVLAPEVALAALILPTLASNLLQALRYGGRAVLETIIAYRVFLIAGAICMAISAQLVTSLSQQALFLLIGLPVTGFAIVQLIGWQPHVRKTSTGLAAFVGSIAGTVGGISGVWGPPTVAYLTAMNTPKAAQMKIQGVIYGLGSVVLFLAHIQSGVLRAETLPLSVVMTVPALVGMVAGLAIQDRIDQQRFRQVTLAVLVIAGLNLVRRGFV